MENHEIKEQLSSLLKQLETKGHNGDTGHIARETKHVLYNAICWIDAYEKTSGKNIEIESRIINSIQKVLDLTTDYYDVSKGYNSKDNRNYKILPYAYVNKVYSVIEYLIEQIEK